MILSLELSHHRRANVWLDEPPPAEFRLSAAVTRVLKPMIAASVVRTIVAVEINFSHVGYALLGAELTSFDVDGLEVVVSVNKSGSVLTDRLAGKGEEVKAGLPSEYSEAVIKGVEKVAASSGFPTNAILRFNWAAHASVSSSPMIFERASALVARLLLLPREVSKEQIAALFG